MYITNDYSNNTTPYIYAVATKAPLVYILPSNLIISPLFVLTFWSMHNYNIQGKNGVAMFLTCPLYILIFCQQQSKQ